MSDKITWSTGQGASTISYLIQDIIDRELDRSDAPEKLEKLLHFFWIIFTKGTRTRLNSGKVSDVICYYWNGYPAGKLFCSKIEVY